MSIRSATFGTCAVALVLWAPVAVADPADPPAIEPAAADAPPSDEVPPPPVDDGRVPSAPPQTVKTPDGWTLTVSSKDEVQLPIAPLTTAVSSREYSAGGVFNGSLVPPESASAPRGVLEVGYQIGCGIDMSTSNGVTLTGSVGLNSGVGLSGPLGALPTGVAPIFSIPVSGGIGVALKPGIVNIVPVVKKEFKGPDPWVMVSNFHIKIDGCVGQSFLRSYAVLTRSTDQSDVVLGYYGVTKQV
jgi:hypothetical protein